MTETKAYETARAAASGAGCHPRCALAAQSPFSGSCVPQMIHSDPAAEPISLERLRALDGQDQA